MLGALIWIIYRFLGHSYEFGPRDFAIILTSILQLLLIGFTIYQYLPSAPKGKLDFSYMFFFRDETILYARFITPFFFLKMYMKVLVSGTC